MLLKISQKNTFTTVITLLDYHKFTIIAFKLKHLLIAWFDFTPHCYLLITMESAGKFEWPAENKEITKIVSSWCSMKILLPNRTWLNSGRSVNSKISYKCLKNIIQIKQSIWYLKICFSYLFKDKPFHDKLYQNFWTLILKKIRSWNYLTQEPSVGTLV